MRIVYIDIDTLRADHLGSYGYHRHTSPNIDRVAAQGVRFNNCYASDAPCLPSRTSLFSGRFGIHTGVIDHAGVAADMFHDGPARGFHSMLGTTNWMWQLRQAGYTTATVSNFAPRHSAWWWLAHFSDVLSDFDGPATADVITPFAIDWLKRNACRDDWFLHINLWDPHAPYRTPESYGPPFADEPPPAWLTEQVRHEHWRGCGPESAQDAAEFQELCMGTTPYDYEQYPQ